MWERRIESDAGALFLVSRALSLCVGTFFVCWKHLMVLETRCVKVYEINNHQCNILVVVLRKRKHVVVLRKLQQCHNTTSSNHEREDIEDIETT